jgi:hypothetical protein
MFVVLLESFSIFFFFKLTPHHGRYNAFIFEGLKGRIHFCVFTECDQNVDWDPTDKPHVESV